MNGQDRERPCLGGLTTTHLARIVLVAFLLTFICMRIMVFLIMARWIPDLYLHLGGTHVHHLNTGIILLSGTGGYLLFAAPSALTRQLIAVLYGIAMGLTFDEFGMWIHLGGSYWQRASFDAVTVVASVFALFAFAPSLRRFRPHHWVTAGLLALAVVAFFVLSAHTARYVGKTLGPKLQKVEAAAPK
jgi:hypothetical protein